MVTHSTRVRSILEYLLVYLGLDDEWVDHRCFNSLLSGHSDQNSNTMMIWPATRISSFFHSLMSCKRNDLISHFPWSNSKRYKVRNGELVEG